MILLNTDRRTLCHFNQSWRSSQIEGVHTAVRSTFIWSGFMKTSTSISCSDMYEIPSWQHKTKNEHSDRQLPGWSHSDLVWIERFSTGTGWWGQAKRRITTAVSERATGSKLQMAQTHPHHSHSWLRDFSSSATVAQLCFALRIPGRLSDAEGRGLSFHTDYSVKLERGEKKKGNKVV